jgi:flagellar biosynthesis/type III secretory pathway chaperone
MHALIDDLTGVLRKEIEQYRQLLVLIRRERGRIVRGELTTLADVVRKKEVLTRDLEQLEASRRTLLDQVATALGVEGEELTLARLAGMVPEESGSTLRSLLAEFRGVVGLLVAANDLNRTLLDRSLDLVQGSLALFKTVVSRSPVYGSAGRLEDTGRPLAVLNQTA